MIRFGLTVGKGSPLYRWLKKNRLALEGVVKTVPKPKPKPKPQAIVMFDDVDVSLLPKGAQAYAGYVDGKWKTYAELQAKFPKAHLLSIAVFPWDDADCLDVEPGDATIAQAPKWVKKQIARGIKPCVYTAISDAQKLVTALSKAGIKRSQYRLWTAHYTYQKHFCGPACGFSFAGNADATQWTDKANGRSLDESICKPDFFS